ncbi:transcription antitermination factor NusB [Neptunicoccus cionae]|uniref:transcription antitermination factor NusB n=1 Tax=Neptunicoccus cionae TaxID=2035344 RepID=UPI000C77C685|nr:transcription antitermination factor NusB [Amylibacter cionae]MBR9864359.1 transcription antitermination factor NusB [Paracoccaceae bacterium]PLS22287.1 transcription antitermination factor NusB [Amylibacter cionae]
MKPADKRQIKSATRMYLVQALFQMEASDTDAETVREEFLNHRFGAQEEEHEWLEGNASFFERLLLAAVSNQAKIDQHTDQALVEKWPLKRIDPTLRALFRAAGAELVSEATPPKVVISEYVDVTKAFFPEGRESKFVNAVLDHMARAFQPDKF